MHYLNIYIEKRVLRRMIPIEEIKIYDPRIHGHTHETLPNLTDKEGHILREFLYKRFLTARIQDETLSDYLFGEKGYFKRDPSISQVIFVNGAFHSAQTREQYYTVDVEKIAQEAKGIPLLFSAPIRVDSHSPQRKPRASSSTSSHSPLSRKLESLAYHI